MFGRTGENTEATHCLCRSFCSSGRPLVPISAGTDNVNQTEQSEKANMKLGDSFHCFVVERIERKKKANFCYK